MQANRILYQIRNFITNPSILNRLIVINVAVFLLVNILTLIYKIANIQANAAICGTNLNEITYFLALPADLHLLLLHPWSVFSYMFLHEQLFHIFFNMFMLFVGGQMFVYFIGQKKLLSVYLMGGLMGAVFYVLAFNLFPIFALTKNCSIAIGASAAVLAVFMAIATYAPNYTVMLFLIGKVKLKYVALIFVAIDIISIDGKNPGGSIAHLGGALWGFLFAMQLRNKSKTHFNIDFSKITAIFKRKKSKMRIDYSETPKKPITDEEYNKIKAEKQKKVDAILDKISKSGYSSLSADEKAFLFSISKKD